MRKKGLRRSATGIEASTSGSTSSSVALRFTAVVLKLRMKSGSWLTAVVSEVFCRAIAFIIWSRLPTSAERSPRRSASAPESCEPSTISCSSERVSRVSSANVRREVERNGFR